MKGIAIRLNIEYLRTLLPREMDGIQRQTIMRLLADQEAKLIALDNLREVEEPIPFLPVGRTRIDRRRSFRFSFKDATARKNCLSFNWDSETWGPG
jgi:hypothetical protein